MVSSKDPSTGLPVYSLYSETLRPTEQMLQGIDNLVFDPQDAGVRFYATTMGYCMEAAAQHKIAFYVLDHPNPLGGDNPRGPHPARILPLTGNAETVRQLEAGVSPDQIVATWPSGLTNFDQLRRKYFLYK